MTRRLLALLPLLALFAGPAPARATDTTAAVEKELRDSAVSKPAGETEESDEETTGEEE